jgi:nitrogen fixation protein FixH
MNILTKGKFTGWHMTIILVVFFGIVMAVNFAMARMAVGTFGGTVVDNSYVASQNYNRWLDSADKQGRLGWDVKLSLSADRHVVVDARQSGLALDKLNAVGDALHPLGRADDIALSFVPQSDGRLLSKAALPAGRWNVQLSLRRGPDIYRISEEVQ